MNYRKLNEEMENEKNFIPVSFIRHQMEIIVKKALSERDLNERYDLELSYEVLRKLIFIWRTTE